MRHDGQGVVFQEDGAGLAAGQGVPGQACQVGVGSQEHGLGVFGQVLGDLVPETAAELGGGFRTVVFLALLDQVPPIGQHFVDRFGLLQLNPLHGHSGHTTKAT